MKKKIDFEKTSTIIKLIGQGDEEEFKDYWSDNIIPKNPFYAWLYSGTNVEEKINSKEYDIAFFESALGLFWEKDAMNYKGGENLIAILSGRITDDGKKIHVLTMTTNPIYRRSGGMSYLIKKVREKFNLDQDDVHFAGLTTMGDKFYVNKTFEKGGTTESKGTFKPLGFAKELGIKPNIARHDMIAKCDCGEKFSYQSSKKNILWQCPECNGIKRIS